MPLTNYLRFQRYVAVVRQFLSNKTNKFSTTSILCNKRNCFNLPKENTKINYRTATIYRTGMTRWTNEKQQKAKGVEIAFRVLLTRTSILTKPSHYFFYISARQNSKQNKQIAKGTSEKAEFQLGLPFCGLYKAFSPHKRSAIRCRSPPYQSFLP